ncbi:MAG: IS200/IS605 family transposase [Candidatus Methanoperedens sp.]|nr:IS200/IS605 family transposase [Candidatus Methanoperedens sp.]
MEFDKYSHSLGESNFHFQFTPKYRRDVFRDVIIKKACEESFLRIAVKYKMVVRALEFGPDHVHLFLGNCKKYSVPQVAQYFKGASSRELRKKYMDRVNIKLYGDSFWSDGYFYESVGRVTSESVEYYIKQQQGKQWADADFEVHKKPQSQKSLKDFFKG